MFRANFSGLLTGSIRQTENLDESAPIAARGGKEVQRSARECTGETERDVRFAGNYACVNAIEVFDEGN